MLLVHKNLITAIYLNLFDALEIQENLATRCIWHPLCLTPTPEKDTFHLRGSMRTLSDGATHLSEQGEALPPLQ